jgi:uncharacterized protein (TIGR00369 family)
MKKMHLDDDRYCFVCGDRNPYGLKLAFNTKDGVTVAEFMPGKTHQGFKDIVHGGIISSILDEAMIKTVLSQGIEAVTAEITVRLKKPLFVGEKAFIKAEITKKGNRLIETSAELKKDKNTVIAVAAAKLIRNV